MSGLIARHMLVAARTPALAAAAFVNVSVLAAFVLVWRHGMPVGPGQSVYEQQQLLQWCLLTALLPWTAVRCQQTRRHDMVLLSLVSGVPPSRALVSGVIATWSVLMCVVISGLPAILLAQQVSGTPLRHAVASILPLAAVSTLAAVAARVWALYSRRSLVAWSAATLSTVIPVLLIGQLPPGWGAVVTAVVAAVTLGAISRTNATMLYLQEAPA